jgi:hypothetical protein
MNLCCLQLAATASTRHLPAPHPKEPLERIAVLLGNPLQAQASPWEYPVLWTQVFQWCASHKRMPPLKTLFRTRVRGGSGRCPASQILVPPMGSHPSISLTKPPLLVCGPDKRVLLSYLVSWHSIFEGIGESIFSWRCGQTLGSGTILTRTFILLDEWYASVADDGGGKLATVVGRGQEKVGTGNRESGRGEEEGSRGSCWNVEDGKDLRVCNPECNKTPPCIDSYSAGERAGTVFGTPSHMRQLFLTSESGPSAVGGIPPEREKEISWSLTTSDAALQARSNGSPSLQPRGTPIKKISSKQGKLLAQLAAAKRDSAAANARRNALRSVISPTEEKLPFANTSRPQASAGHSDEVPDSNSAANTPGSNKSLGSCGTGTLLLDMAALRRDKQLSRLTSPISDGTPSLLTDSSMSATTISTSARSSLNASKYSSVPHGYLPVNGSAAVEDRDMFSVDPRIPLGEAGHLWYLSIGIDWLADKDSWGTMLTGMLSIMETFPLMIDGF